MSKAFRWTLAITGIVILAAGLLWAGMLIGRSYWGTAGFGPGMMGPGVPGLGMHGWDGYRGEKVQPGYGPGDGFGRGYRQGPGMMGPGFNRRERGWSGGFGQVGPGMMGGSGMMGGPGIPGQGMMGGYSGGLSAAEPLSIQEAQQAVEQYLERLGNDDLQVEEVMIFDNHAYAEIVEKSTGIGAMEVLVDPVTLAVYPEHGPNMMWNLKYSPMGGPGMMGGYYRGQGAANPPEVSAEMTVSPEQAIEAAQIFLDVELPGATAGEQAEPFYGYYTLHVERDGEIIGMLSVNGYSAAVFPHTWHGDFVEMSAE